MSDRGLITAALERADRGEPGANEELWALVYEDLTRLASGRLGGLRAGETLQASGLVHEAWMKMVGDDREAWRNRGHFFAVAALSMRNVLVDQARKKHALQRGGGAQPGGITDTVAEGCAASDTDPGELLALDEALTALAKEFERPAQVTMLRYFAGCTIPEVAEMLGVSTRIIDRESHFARAWLRRFMTRGDGS